MTQLPQDSPDSSLTTGELLDVAARFKDAMAHVATPVAVVTTENAGTPFGTTVSAFASLSMDPPMILVSLDRSSRLLAEVRHSKKFAVNVLGAHQEDVARRFAKKSDDKFSGLAWRYERDLPQIDSAVGWIACTVSSFIDGGDHIVLLGRVYAVDHAEIAPLTYHLRSFGTHFILQEMGTP
jgi:flavin reductase (DIM6/NTAB) family NADH-FMN oxidoreductase RutF